MLDFRHLSYFVAIAEEGSITAAAHRLGIQQPPLTRQIKALEERLGVRLLRRLPRGVELTEAGRVMADEGAALLARLDHAVDAIRRAGRGEQGRIAVGYTSSAGFHPLLPDLIRTFRQRWPGIALVLEEFGTAELIEALRNERLDAALIRSPAADASGLVLEPVLEERMLVALPSGHPLAGRTRKRAIPLSALADETFILYRRPAGPGLYDGIIAACMAAGFSPKVGQEAPRMLSTLSLVAAGLGVSIVPACMRRLDTENVVYLPIEESAGLVAPIKFAARKGDRSTALQHLRSLVREFARGEHGTEA